MKKLLSNNFIFPLFLAALTLFGCRIPEDPEAVGYQFLNALADQDFESAKEYATDETAMMLDFMTEMLKAQPVPVKKDKNRKIKLKEIKMQKGDTTAMCLFILNDLEEVPIELKKRKGLWKAHLPFDMPQGDFSEQAPMFEEELDSIPMNNDSLNNTTPSLNQANP
jgi:hypothetical protein